MDNYKKKAIQMITELTLKESAHPEVIPYIPQKTKTGEYEKRDLPRRIGGERFKYSKTLLKLLTELEAEPRANIHSIMVTKRGEVILEASARGYSPNLFHLAHSMSKTVTGLALGFLFDEGLIDLQRAALEFFPDVAPKGDKYSTLTVYDLLSMKSGSPFAEMGSVTDDKWVEAFFASEPQFKPGTEFGYNSMNSYLLGRIVTYVTGEDLEAYVARKLFSPLGIENYLWEKSPEGYRKGGFGLYLSAESFAKIGILIAGRGKYLGKRILSERYIELMTKIASRLPDESTKSGFDYGLHVWVTDGGEEILLNGMLGQNVWIYPREEIVISVNSGNNELFTDSPMIAIIRENLKRDLSRETSLYSDHKRLLRAADSFLDSRHSIRYLMQKRGIREFLGLRPRRPFDERFNSLLGSYALIYNNSGLLPLFVSVMQNNYSGGIEALSFERRQDELIMLVTEGGVTHTIPLGLYAPSPSTLSFNGEKYRVMASAEATEDENRDPVYKIELIFPELPNTKMIKITHTGSGIQVRMSEMPNQKIAESFFSSMKEGLGMSFAIGLLEKKMGVGFIQKKTEDIFNPTLEAISTDIPNWRNLISEENERRRDERERLMKPIAPILSKFLNEDKGEHKKEEKSAFGSFFSKALSLLFGKAKAESGAAEDGIIIDIPDDAITFLEADIITDDDFKDESDG